MIKEIKILGCLAVLAILFVITYGWPINLSQYVDINYYLGQVPP